MPIYEHHEYIHGELPFILNHTIRNSKRYPAYERSNLHENVEIVFVTEGEAAIRADGKEIIARAGDTVIFGTNVLHAVGTYSKAAFYYLIVDRSFCRENYFDTNLLKFETLVSDSLLHDMMRDIIDAYSHLDDRLFSKQDIRARVLLLMSYICENYSQKDEQGNGNQTLNYIKLSIEYICRNFNRPLSLDEVAQRVGVSKYHFTRTFRETTGETFLKYLNRVRCDYAKQLLLNTDKTVSQICDECGFISPSYFSRTFEKYAGILPSEYRKSKQLQS